MFFKHLTRVQFSSVVLEIKLKKKKEVKMKEFLESFTKSKLNTLMSITGFVYFVTSFYFLHMPWYLYLTVLATFTSTFSWGYQKCKSLNKDS